MNTLEVPSKIAVCPYCGGNLFYSIVGECMDGDKWIVDDVDIECEKDNLEDDSHDFEPWHTWPPIQKAVIDWINGDL